MNRTYRSFLLLALGLVLGTGAWAQGPAAPGAWQAPEALGEMLERAGTVALYRSGTHPTAPVSEAQGAAQPTTETRLEPNYPNPFATSTQIPFHLAATGEINLRIYNLVGAPVAVLQKGYLEAGSYTLTWDASQQPAGIYFCQLSIGNKVYTKKMTVSR